MPKHPVSPRPAPAKPAKAVARAASHAAVLWAGQALCGLLAAGLLLAVAAVWPAWWQRLALRDILQWGFTGPALIALASWWGVPRLVMQRQSAARWAAAQVALLTFWLAIGLCVICAHLWAHQDWLVASLPASWSVGLGIGALSPLAVAAVAPQVVQGRA